MKTTARLLLVTVSICLVTVSNVHNSRHMMKTKEEYELENDAKHKSKKENE